MSLFESMNVATRGLAAAQLGISVTGQNITNASTDGYSRKRIEQSADWRRDGSYGQMGFGVEVYSINRARDQFIDRLVNEEYTRYGYFSVKDAGFDRIEAIFSEPKDHALNSLLNHFWNGWADLANNPEKAGARETLRSAAQSLVGQFHYLSTQLRSYKDTINDEIEVRVGRINEITASIHRCNVVISGSEGVFGNKANDTRDQRDKLLEELAQLIDVDYFEDERGVLQLSTSGHMLVSNAKNHELLMRRTQVTEQDGYQYSRVEISFAQTGKEYKPKQGELRALMDLRDVDIPKYEEYINSLAAGLITEVNKIHQNGYSLSGLTFIDFFDSEPGKLNAANIQLSAAVTSNINNIAAGAGGKKTTTETANLVKMLDVTTGQTEDVWKYGDYNNLIVRDGDGNLLTEGVHYDIDPNGVVEFNVTGQVSLSFNYTGLEYVVPQLSPDPPDNVHVIDLLDANDQFRYIYKNSLEIKDSNGNILQEGKDYEIDYNIGRITFKYSATNAFGDPANTVSVRFDYHENGYSGPGDGDNALAIYQLRDAAVMQSDSFGRSTQTINQFYAGALGRLGVERNEAMAGLDTRVYALQQLKTRQDQVMGVNLNEEIAELMRYEHTYQASARYLSTINSMLEILLNM
ncbi:MAG: flagellar hook-associated protein FlgK [Fibromonadaceae bacterium]|jgi:flagellar hook-associated protein 1 FlgK|nr:flagellar hook-associated protein FlgK [Fibromonadaceae bacterium]